MQDKEGNKGNIISEDFKVKDNEKLFLKVSVNSPEVLSTLFGAAEKEIKIIKFRYVLIYHLKAVGLGSQSYTYR